MLQRAYSLLTIKAIDADQRVITGIATTPTADRSGDIVEPKGAQFKLPIPLLWQHNSREPIGEVFAAKVTADGIEIQARLVSIDEPGKLKDRLDEAWQSIKAGLVRGLSIGFTSIEDSRINETYSYRFIKWLWLELSAVTIPANADATILAIKSSDVGLAASGTESAVVSPKKTLSGVSDTTRVVKAPRAKDRTMKKSIAEQKKDFEAKRVTASARMAEIMEKSGEDGLTLDKEQEDEYDGLKVEVKALDAHLARLDDHEKTLAAQAKAIDGTTEKDAAESRHPHRVITVEKKLPKGIAFARFAMCIAAAKGSRGDAMDLAKMFYPDDSMLLASLRIKTAIGAGAVVTSHWADDLVPYNVLQGDFIEFLRPGSILGKFGGPNPGGGPDYPSLRQVPFNVRVSGASAGFTGSWVGEGKPAPVSKMTTFNTALTWAKVEALAVLTKEEVRFSNPSAEMVVRDDIAKAVNARIDIDFVDPALAAVANVSPASITYGVVATTPTGTTAAYARTNLATMIALFATNNLNPSDIVLIMSSSMALQFSMMVNTLGNSDFPDISMKGGSLRGFPVIVSEHLTSVGSPSTQTIVAVKASDVYLADDGNVTVDASGEASIEMLDSSLVQDGIAGTGTSLVNLWQSGLLGFLAQREITWKLRRSTAVQYLSPAAYAA